jgi:hypothetical protein
VQVYLQLGHLVHKPSGASFFSEVEVRIPFLIRLNQLLDDSSVFPSSPARFESKSSSYFIQAILDKGKEIKYTEKEFAATIPIIPIAIGTIGDKNILYKYSYRYFTPPALLSSIPSFKIRISYYRYFLQGSN